VGKSHGGPRPAQGLRAPRNTIAQRHLVIVYILYKHGNLKLITNSSRTTKTNTEVMHHGHDISRKKVEVEGLEQAQASPLEISHPPGVMHDLVGVDIFEFHYDRMNELAP
jgi:hypothetical protein